MRVAFRVDASRAIGIGHLMRCLTLADSLKSDGARTRFVARHLPPSLHSLLHSKGHELALLDGLAAEPLDDVPHARFLGTSQRQDASNTRAALADGAWDWVVVDHYGIDARWESALRGSVRHVMAIDDVADRAHDCDVLLDQNLYSDMASRYEGKAPQRCSMLLGPSHALVREEFREWRARIRPRTGPVRRLLVFFGGIDPCNFTGKALRALERIGGTDLIVDVVIGAEHADRAEIEAACETRGYRCYIQTSRMAELMAAADLALGAGGSASWERCCVGLAVVSVAFADNQFDIADALDAVGASMFVGDESTATQERIETAVASLLADNERLSRMSAKAYSLVDGRGCERVRAVMSDWR